MKDWFFLKKFEIFNWWTFDKEIETFYIDDDITVVSGDNWSWKSTIVDALVSLLVPNQARKYNLSASDSQKKSRTEITYVRWAYKNKETDDWIQVSYLRWNETWISTYSVLLAYFRDESNWREITLSSFFKTNSTSEIDKFFIISWQELFIKNDFVAILNNKELTSPISKLKQSLQNKIDTKIYDKFKEYQEDYSRKFWLRSNAVELFNKVVSLKEIKDLNSFFRENMLELNTEIQKEFQEVEKNYLWVRDIYEKIILSEEKLAILEPFIQTKKELEEKNQELKNISTLQENIQTYTNFLEKDLVKGEINIKKLDLESKNIQKDSKKSELIKLEEKQKDIEFTIKNSNFSKRLDSINTNIDFETKELHQRQKTFDDYCRYVKNSFKSEFLESRTVWAVSEFHSEKNSNLKEKEIFIKDFEILEKLDLKEEDFLNHKNILKDFEKNIWIEKQDLLLKKSDKLAIKRELEQQIKQKKEDLNYFKNRQNLLPKKLSDIRTFICQNLEIKEEEISFICELIKVKPEEKSWEFAIEKLLSSFALEMLVPEHLIEKVNSFINSHNLKWKLKYNKITYIEDVKEEQAEKYLISKLDFKSSNFSKWLKHKIISKFDYICLNDTTDKDYYTFDKVLTLNWLIKNKNTYQKDDRDFFVKDYILWWDVKAKIEILEKDLQLLEKDFSKQKQEIEKIDNQLENIEVKTKNLILLENIKTFSQIDFKTPQNEIEKLKKEKKDLEDSNTDFKKYFSELEFLKTQISSKKQELESLQKDIWVLENIIEKLIKRFEKLDEILKNIDFSLVKNIFSNTKYDFEDITLENIIDKKEEKLETLNRKKDRLNESIQTLNNKLNWYAISYRENKMETSEKLEIWTNISVEDFRFYLEKQYHKIKDEELYKYKQKFEKEFRETLFIRLHDFYMSLENEETHIKEKIDEINKSLKDIKYSSTTYIEISLKPNTKKSDGIEEFKRNFKEKVIYKRELDIIDKMKAFEDLKNFMSELLDREREDWRNNMIDVRNWFLFSIKEKYLLWDDLKDIFESSSWKSGWQTIKLAYSILAAALLYQYWIKEEDNSILSSKLSKSFRLVVIDEVFAKLDIDNSRYVLNLFSSLWLQLFIITPTNTINILEDYVKTIYFISNKTWEKSFKNKLDIISRQKIEEKVKEKDISLEENKFLLKDKEKLNSSLDELRDSL